MDLADFFASKNIAGIDAGILKEIFRGSYPNAVIRELTPGILKIKAAEGHNLNHKIIGCVSRYYAPNNEKKEKKTTSGNPGLKCYHVKDYLGLDKSFCSCAACHLMCMTAEENGLMHRINVKKKRSQ